jgi:UDP-3-O-[3-hydroxymyristoyl] N-acetylglucosamine deacetylase
LPVQLTLHPARVNSGVVLRRRNVGACLETPAHAESVSSTTHATTLGFGDARVSTVEHLLAALYALGVGNVCIEVDGPEIPVMDGSAVSFLHLIRSAGIYEQDESQAVLEIHKKIEFVDGVRRIALSPSRHFSITYNVEFLHPAIGRQELRIPRSTPEVFEREIARARTFGFLSEVDALRRAGLARGGSLSNTVVLDSDRVLNRDGLRWPDEFVRHKVLDLIGDLSLLGLPIRGHVEVERGGHFMHHQLVKAVLADRSAWRLRGGDASFPHPLELLNAATAAG